MLTNYTRCLTLQPFVNSVKVLCTLVNNTNNMAFKDLLIFQQIPNILLKSFCMKL